VPELAAVSLADRLVQLGEHPQPLVRDAGDDAAAVFRLALSGDQPARFEAVEQSGDVGILRHHALTDLAAGGAFPFRAAQDAERVVLRRRQVGAADRLGHRARKPLGRAQQAHVHFLLAACARSCLPQLFLRLTHGT
jgi:hypothetical protein